MLLGLLLGMCASPVVAAAAPCPNEALRQGPSAQLPECRAYELVTPPDSNGRRFADLTVLGRDYDLFPTEMVSPLNGTFVFSTIGSALRDPQGGDGRNDGDVWEVQRFASGWHVGRHVSPSGNESIGPLIGGMSPDHGYIFTFAPQFGESGSLAAEGEADYIGDSQGHFELTGIGSLGNERLAQGRYVSAGGEHVIFSTGRSSGGSQWCSEVGLSCPVKRLELGAPPNGTGAIYDRAADGPTHVVSLLPGDVTPAAGQDAAYQGSSADGTRVAFKIGGTLYVRIENAETKKVTEESSTYAGLSRDGHYLFYVVAGNVFRFDTATGSDQQLNSGGDALVTNISADGSHVYFISESQLDGSKGVAGQPNMYLWKGGLPEYIATVAPSDLESTLSGSIGYPALGNWPLVTAPSGIRGPGTDSSRTTPDGQVIVFESRARLTTYDNAARTEVYRYDDADKSLRCVSCNPSGVAAIADARLQNLRFIHRTTFLRNLSDDGTRVFFETPEALVEGDVDGINDIYEWYQMPGEVAPAVDLISSGNSLEYPSKLVGVAPEPNVLMGITPTGSDVFFLSQDALAQGAGSGGASAIYDARIGGGFPVAAPPPECNESTTCHGAGSAQPLLQEPHSEAGSKSGNVKPRKAQCGRRKHRKEASRARSCKRHKHRRGGSK